MPRTKPTPEPVLRDWEQVNLALREIGQINREVASAETVMNKRIDDLKAKFDGALEGPIARRARLEKDLQEFCEQNKAEFAKKRSRDCTFGSVSFRIVHTLKPATRMTWAKVIDVLKALGTRGTDYLRIKESVDKDRLRDEAIAGADVSEFGVRLCTTDQFGYKIDAEAIEEQGQ